MGYYRGFREELFLLFQVPYLLMVGAIATAVCFVRRMFHREG